MLKRLLFVTPFALLPAAEGHRKRMAMTLAAIRARGYQIDILFISKEYGWSERFNRGAFREMQGLADGFFHVHQPTPAEPAGPVYTVDEWWSEELDRYCEWLFANNGYEAVFCNYVFMSRVFDTIRTRTRKLLETHDQFAGRKEMLQAHGLRPEFFYTSRGEERKGVRRADTVIAIKDEEADHFRRLTPAEVVTLPFTEPAVAGSARPMRPRRPGEPLLFGFFGSANSLNVQAVRAFADHLAAAGDGVAGGCEVHVYGTVCTRLGGILPPTIRLMGALDQPGDFYAAVDAVVNFQAVSTGLKIKVAEALAFGAPLLSLAHAFEGFGAPAHPAQACADLDELVAWMRAAAADPACLPALAAASCTVQDALERRTEGTLDRLFGSAESDPAMLFVVDGALFNRSVAYRHMVATFRLAFGRSWAACVLVPEGTVPAGEFRAFVDGFGRVADEGDLFALAPAGVAVLFAADRIAPVLLDRFDRVVVVAPACDYAAPGAATRLAAATARDLLVVRGRGAGLARCDRDDPRRPTFHLSQFRWIPWDLALAQRPQHFTREEAIWVFRATAPDPRVDAWLRGIAGGRPLRTWETAGSGDAHRRLFEDRVVPVAVVAIGTDVAFPLLEEWLTVTGVPFRRLPLPMAGVAPEPVRFPQPLSALVAPIGPAEPGPPRPLGDWHASGWSALAEAIGGNAAVQSTSAAASPSLAAGADSVAP